MQSCNYNTGSQHYRWFLTTTDTHTHTHTSTLVYTHKKNTDNTIFLLLISKEISINASQVREYIIFPVIHSIQTYQTHFRDDLITRQSNLRKTNDPSNLP